MTLIRKFVEVFFRDTPADVTFADLTQPGSGRVKIVVPRTASGIQPVVRRYRGAESQTSAYLLVAQE